MRGRMPVFGCSGVQVFGRDKAASGFCVAVLAGVGLVSCVNPALADGKARPLVLWYRQPAREWIEALPIGNGRMGAMVFGKPDHERIQLNDNTLWDGHPQDTTNPEALKHLPEVRRLLFEGKNKFQCGMGGRKSYYFHILESGFSSRGNDIIFCQVFFRFFIYHPQSLCTFQFLCIL